MPAGDSSNLREAGLRKIAIVRRWLLAGSVTLTGVLAAVAANAFHGKTIKPSGTGATSQSSASEAPNRAGQSPAESSQGSSSSLTPPAQAPQSTETGEPVHEPSPAEPSEAAQSTSEAPVISGGS